MLIHSRLVGFLLFGSVLLSGSAWAGTSAIEGIVKDPNGRPISGADIRIEAKDRSSSNTIVKTDAKGHYVSGALPAGTYRVSLILKGAVKASIDSAKTKSGKPTQLNFDLKLAASASQASGSVKKTKHKVWVPAGTGTHLGGRWVEEDDTGAVPRSGANADKVDSVDGSALKKLQGTVANPTRP
jgi:hypothetical protein